MKSIIKYRFLFITVVFVNAMVMAKPVKVVFNKLSVVKGPNVYLSEVADITNLHGNIGKTLSNIVVAKSMRAGSVRLVSTDHIIRYCMRSVNLNNFKFLNTGTITVKMDKKEIKSSEIKKHIKKYIYSNMRWNSDNILINYKKIPSSVVIPNRPYKIEISNPNEYDFKGAGRLQVSFIQNNKKVNVAHISLNIQVSAFVYVATHKIERKKLVNDSDLMLEKMNITRMKNSPFMSKEKIVGKVACRTISKGRILDNTMVIKKPVISNGKHIKVVVKAGKTTISADAIARSQGYTGDVIPVYCYATKKTINGKIMSGNMVLIEQ